MVVGMKFEVLRLEHCVVQLPVGAPSSQAAAQVLVAFGVPPTTLGNGIFSLAITDEEVSIVSPVTVAQGILPGGTKFQIEPGWRVLKIRGPLPFEMVGVLASVATTLADAKISIFATSTYDTDYVLVKQDKLLGAVAALRTAGHEVEELS